MGIKPAQKAYLKHGKEHRKQEPAVVLVMVLDW